MNPTSPGAIWADLRGRPWLTPLLGTLVALLSWRLAFILPAPGLDPSWYAGLNLAIHDGKQFGTEIVFTYGPLGFLRRPFLFFTGLGPIAFVYASALLLAFACSLVWRIRLEAGVVIACVSSFLIIALIPMAELGTPLAVIWALALLSRRQPQHTLTVLMTGGAVFAAIEAQIKLSSGPLIFLVLLMALVGARASRRQVGTFLGVFIASFGVLWMAAGQHLSNLPDFTVNSIEIAAGYNQAMGTVGDSIAIPLAFISLVGLTAAWAWFGDWRDRRAQVAAVSVVLLTGFLAYKQGVVRADAGHQATFLGLMAIIWLAVPSTPRLKALTFAGAAVLVVLSINTRGSDWTGTINPIDNLSVFREQVELLADSDRREEIAQRQRFGLILAYGLPPEGVEQLRSGGASIDPWETAMAWAYNLDWDPLPVFQTYTAFTSKLDRLNADALESPDGPDRIVRPDPDSVDPLSPGGLDGRFPGWDPPAQMIATICNYEVTSTGNAWQVLTRTGNRCETPAPSGVVKASFNEVVDVPAPGPSEIVYAKVKGAEVHGFELLRNLLYKPVARVAATADGGRFRLVPDTAQDGLILRAGKRAGLGTAPNALVPQTPTLELTGPDGDLSFEFFRMKVHRKGST